MPVWAAAHAGFEDVAERSGVRFEHAASATSQKYLPETMGSGVAMFDYNNDGLLDLFFVNGAALRDPMPPGAKPDKNDPRFWNRLYRNNGDGTFTDVTKAAGLQGEGYGMGVAAGDFDNDGWPDLYVTNAGRNTLYHNNGDGTFTDVTEKAGVAASGWSVARMLRRLRSRRASRSHRDPLPGLGVQQQSSIAVRISPGIAAIATRTNSNPSRPGLPEQWRRNLHGRFQ